MTRRTPSVVLASGLALVLGLGLAVAGCTGDDGDRDPGATGRTSVTKVPEPDPANDAISQPLMLALAQAKNFHHKAKVYMADGNLREATAAVRQILALEFPPGAPEADDVRLDARALLAKLLVAQGDVEGAMKVVDDGLAATTRESFFVANLYTVRGEVLEARAAALDGDTTTPGGKDQARAARRAAIEAYDRSIQINDALQRSLLAPDGTLAPAPAGKGQP